MPRSARVHAEEVRRRRRLLTKEQRRDPAYAADSPNSVLRDSEEEERCRASGDRVVPTEPVEPREIYQWTGIVREIVSAPPISLGATLQQEQAYLEHWKSTH
ncbi:hypothetical protein D1007_12171 [Hordeum vulgare]|nr:hypothetical protein D1007_12171 [Hordeum vulgare]